ncbi:Y-family DNA polymerase [Paraglaciecola aestuariivivens]
MMQSLWLYLHFPQLQLDSLLQQCDSSVSHAYVIFDPHTNQICQLNQQAYQTGIRLGMGLGTAAMLNAELQVVTYQPKFSKQQLHNIAQSLYLVTSDISFFAPDGLLLRVHNMLNLYGSLTTYWQALSQQLSTQQVSFHYATGHSPLAARLLARSAWDKVTDDHSSIHQAMASIALTNSDLAPQVVTKLARVGVHNIKSLLSLSVAELAKRFDIEVATYLGKLTAEIPHPVDFFHPKKAFECFTELLYEIENTQILQRPISQLLQKLESFLKTRDLLTQSLIFTFYQRDAQSIQLNVHSQQGEYLAEAWATLTALKLEHVKLEAPIFAINLQAENSYLRSPEKQDLFAHKRGALSRLQLVSLLQAKLGDSAVFSPQLTADYRPEHSLVQQTCLINKPHQFALFALRPSFLLSPPQPLQEKVSIAYGPERIETGWWDCQSVTRDYFIAQNVQAQWYWIFKTPEGAWYLHGVFS